MYIIITKDSTNEIVKKIDVSDKTEAQRYKILGGYVSKIDHTKFSYDMLSGEDLENYNPNIDYINSK